MQNYIKSQTRLAFVQYIFQSEFLNEDTKDRKVVSFVYSNYKMKYFDYKIFIKSFNTANLGYNKESFFETSFSLFYNIPY